MIGDRDGFDDQISAERAGDVEIGLRIESDGIGGDVIGAAEPFGPKEISIRRIFYDETVFWMLEDGCEFVSEMPPLKSKFVDVKVAMV